MLQLLGMYQTQLISGYRYSELVRKDYSLDEAQRLSVQSADETLRERENFDYRYDEMLSKSQYNDQAFCRRNLTFIATYFSLGLQCS